MKRIALLALALALMIANPHLACAQNDEYIFILGARGNPYWTAMADAINETAKAKNIKAIVYQTESDRDAEGELNICQTAIQRKPKVLVMQAINASIGIECFKQATSAGIIVADVDAHLTVDEAEKAGIHLAYTVGSDNFLIGQEAAKFVGGIVGKTDPKIFILEGSAGSITSQKRVDGFSTRIKSMMPSAKIVASISAEWDRLKAINTTADILQRQPDIDIIYAANDMMALGAAEAVHNANKTSIKIIGVDGTADARKAVLDGRLTATVAQLPYLMGIRTTELAIAVTQQQKINQVEITPTPVLTSEYLKSGNAPLLQYIR